MGSFTVEGETFATAEHYMMFQKAMLFGDKHAASQILTADHPGEARVLVEASPRDTIWGIGPGCPGG